MKRSTPNRRTRRRLAALAAAALLASTPAAWAEPTNRIVARVNDRIATLYDYETRLEDAMRREREDAPTEPAARDDYMRELARGVMRDILEELLILSRADQLDITVTANDVTESINRIRKANQLENDEEYRAALAQAGLTPEMLRAQSEASLRSQRVIGREVYGAIQLEEEDLRRYYRDHIDEFRTPEQVKLREVVVLDDTGVSPVAQTTAEALAATVASGKTLEEAIGALPPGTVSSIIQLGWVEQGDLDAALEKAAWTLAPDAWSVPTRARGGIHLVQLLERRESSVPAFKDVEAQIRQREERARLDERMKGYLVELEKKSYLYLDPPPEAAGFRAESEGSSGRDFPFIIPSETSTEAEGGGKGKGGKDGKEATAARKAAEDAGAPAQVDKAAADEVEAAEEAAAEAAGAEEAAAAREKARREAQEAERDLEDAEEIEEWPPKPQRAEPAPVPPPPPATPEDTPPPGSGAR